MSRNPALEMLRNPRPYPHGENGTTPPRTKQPNRALNELRNPQPYPSVSQPAQPGRNAPPNASQPRPPQNDQLSNLRNPKPYPTARQPQGSPTGPQSTGTQGKPTGEPQKRKPRIAVSSGAPRPYQQPRQTAQHITPPVRTLPPSASQPRSTPTQSLDTTPRTTTPDSLYSTTIPVASNRTTTPRATNGPASNQPYPTYRDPPPVDSNPRLTPTSGNYESDVPDQDRDSSSRKSFGRDLPSPESDIESGPASERTPSPIPEKKMTAYEETDNQPEFVKSTSRLADKNGGDRKKIYDRGSCIGRHRLIWIMALIFIVILALVLVLGLTLANRGANFSRAFAITLGEECNMVCSNPSENGYSRRSVLMIALDGFRPEFMNASWRETIPNIHRLAECGSIATKMEPSYPSTTYPNLYTLVTGLYPSIHGIVADYFERDGIAGKFDPRNKPKSSTLQDPGWYNGKPIWQLAKEQDKITGSHSWIGNDVREQSINGFSVDPNPNYHVQHNPDINFHARIQSALNWFTLPTNKAQFVNVYMEEPGRTIMKYGVSSNEVKMALEEVDDAIGLFMENLVRDEATDCFDIVIVSTNGHLDVSCDNTTYFDAILRNTLFYETSTHDMNSMAFLKPTTASPTDSDTAEELVSKLGCQTRPFKSYTLDTVPPQYHYYNKYRREAALVIMDDWHTFVGTQQNFNREMCTGARGGYNPSNPEMKGVLIGFGPSFKIKYSMMKGFSNVEVYNLITELVDVLPENNNGTHGTLNDMLRSPELPLTDVQDQTYFKGEASMCMFPNDKNSKKIEANTGCQCNNDALTNVQINNINDKDNLLDITPGTRETLIREKHAPLGAPLLVNMGRVAGEHHCQLVQANYMTVFENKLSIPLYVAYKVPEQTSRSTLQSCYRYDVRLSPEVSPKCSSYNSPNVGPLPDGMTMAFLLQQSLAGDLNDQFNILITSNMVPMWNQFVTDVWNPIAGRLRNMANRDGDILVVAGPAFDTNRDGSRDTYKDIALLSNAWVGKTPVPTHYFLVVTRCEDTDQEVSLCDVDKLRTMAYIFPHTRGILTCDQSIQDYMMTYQASVVDVERISGMFFFSRIASEDDERTLKLLLALKTSRETL